jgi:branched-chain amino acid aminotransferase
METALAYRDGELTSLHELTVGIRTHALQYGTGVFEGIRAHLNPTTGQLLLFRAPEHFARLEASARMLHMKTGRTVDELCAATVDLLARNGVREDTYIRPMVFKSSEAMGLWHDGMSESLVIFHVPFGRYMKSEGVKCCVSTWRRPDGNSLPARAKISGSYAQSGVARAQALADGYDEAILLSSRGHVAEGCGENIFLVSGGTLVTPSAGEDLLAGITRESLITLATRELGLRVEERTVNRGELYVADEVFLCGTAAEVTPVVSIDGHRVGGGKVGPITQAITGLYSDVVHGQRAEYADWCLGVY